MNDQCAVVDFSFPGCLTPYEEDYYPSAYLRPPLLHLPFPHSVPATKPFLALCLACCKPGKTALLNNKRTQCWETLFSDITDYQQFPCLKSYQGEWDVPLLPGGSELWGSL